MADYNRNRNRYGSDEYGNRDQNYNDRQNNYNRNYDDTNYDRESDWRNMDVNRQSNYGRTSYGNTATGNYNNTGAYGGGGYGRYPDDYQQSHRNMSGGFNDRYDANYQGQRDWGRNDADSGMNYNDNYRSNRRTHDMGNDAYHYSNRNNMDYGNRGYEDWQRTSGERSRYGGDTSNYGNMNQGGYDRDWWDRTRDEVSSWFGDDDAERRRRMDRMNTGGHRGKGPKDYHRSEDRIREDVCDRLTDDDLLDATNIQVEIQGENVILSGTVHNRNQKRRAEDLAESISGVRDVENRIRIEHNDSFSEGSRGTMDQSGTDY